MNDNNVLRVTVDNNVQEFELDLNDFNDTEALLGGFPVIVRTKEICKVCGPDAVMLVVDDGFQKQLKPNYVGSLMYAPGLIVGDVIFCKEICGELQPFDEVEIDHLKCNFIDRFECTDEYDVDPRFAAICAVCEGSDCRGCGLYKEGSKKWVD